MEYCSALKGKEILAHATTWINPKDMPGEISQSQKDKYCLQSIYNNYINSSHIYYFHLKSKGNLLWISLYLCCILFLAIF